MCKTFQKIVLFHKISIYEENGRKKIWKRKLKYVPHEIFIRKEMICHSLFLKNHLYILFEKTKHVIYVYTFLTVSILLILYFF